MAEDFERSSIPDGPVRAALVQLLAAHAMPVWGFGQRDAYERLVMAGPGLDQWVRTAGLWAEMERMCWEWEQLVGGVTTRQPDAIVLNGIGALSDATVAAGADWIDLILRAVCLDALGEQLVRTLTDSSYAPLQRHARTMVTYKRGQTADGCDALAEVVRLEQLDRALVLDRIDAWRRLTTAHAERIDAMQIENDWLAKGLAAEFVAAEALGRVEARLEKYTKG